MPPISPNSIHWTGLPRYCLPHIRTVSQSSLSILYDSPSFAAQIVFRCPLGEAFERTRQAQQMRARRLRIARIEAVFPPLAITRRSVRENRVSTTRRKVVFPRRRTDSIRASASLKSRRRPSGHSRHARRLTAQQKLITSRASLRRAVSGKQPRRSTSTTRGSSSPRRSTSTRSSALFRGPSTKSAPGNKRLPQIQIHKSRSLRSRTPRRLASPAPYWGAIPSPTPQAKKTQLDKQTFISRRVDGKFVHEPLPLVKQSANDVLHRGLSDSSRKSRMYDKRLPTRKPQAELPSGYIILPDAKPDFPFLFPSTLDFAKLDGSSAGRSSSSTTTQMLYPDEDSSSDILNVASRTTSEARALDDFTQGLQQHLQTTYGNRNPRPRSPSVAQTIVSTHTLQDLVAFREEFAAAGLAVTSKDQKGHKNQRQSERNTPPKVKVQQNRGPRARRQSIIGSSTAGLPRTAYSTLNVPVGVESKSPRTASPLAEIASPAVVAVQLPIVQQIKPAEKSNIPIPREKPAPKKALPWLKNSEFGTIPFRAPFPLPSEAPSRATNNSSVTTIIDFSPHPSEFWNKQGLDFDDFQNRHPGLSMEVNAPSSYDDDHGSEIIMLENEIKSPIATVAPQQALPQQEVNKDIIIHDKTPPPKPLRIEVSERGSYSGGGHRAPSPLQTQLFPEDIHDDDELDSTDLVRADSFEDDRDKNPHVADGLPSMPDFSSFVTSSGSASARRRSSSVPRPKSAGDERGMDPPIVGRRASKEEIWAEKRRRSKEEFLMQARNQQNPYDDQRTKFEIKKVTPWELGVGSETTATEAGTGKGKNASNAGEQPVLEIIGTKEAPKEDKIRAPLESDAPSQFSDRKGLFGHGKLSDLKSKMRGLFSGDRESRSSTEDELSLASPPPSVPHSDPFARSLRAQGKEEEKEASPKPTIIVPECEECRHPRADPQAPTNRPSSLNEPKSARSFQEWQAGVPFKPLSRESSLNESPAEDLLPCGHAKKPRAGDPVKRNVAARRTKAPPSIRKEASRAPSIFTIQETVPKTAPKVAPRIKPPPVQGQLNKKPVVMSAPSSSSEGQEISDGDVLKGLGIVMEGVMNGDVRRWIEEATGTNVRRFLGGLALMDGLGTGALANRARETAGKRRVALQRLGSGKRKKGRSEGSGK